MVLDFLVPRPKMVKRVEDAPKEITYTAVGDSITDGIGDTNDNQGFVGALKKQLEQEKNLTVVTYNYGYTGKTSAIIRKKIESNKKLRKSISKSDLITIEMGGNDIIYTIQNNFFNLQRRDFDPLVSKYEKNLDHSIKEIRKLNPKAPIIVLGIYNPFYLFFNQLTDLNEIFKEWNQVTLNESKKFKNIFFQDIDGLINGQSAKKIVDGKTINRYLSKKDDVHPNGLGYGLIANELFKLIEKKNIIR